MPLDDVFGVLTDFFGGDEEKARKALLAPPGPMPNPQAAPQPQMPAMAPPDANLGQPPQQQGPGQQDYAAAALQMIQPQKPKEQSWGDIGKGLIAPLAIGVLSSLYGKAQGHQGSAYGGALAGIQAWNTMRQQEQQRQALQQRQGMSTAHLLAQLSGAAGSHEIAQSNLALRQQSLEQTKAQQAATNAFRKASSARGEERLSLAKDLHGLQKQHLESQIDLDRYIKENDRLGVALKTNQVETVEGALRGRGLIARSARDLNLPHIGEGVESGAMSPEDGIKAIAQAEQKAAGVGGKTPHVTWKKTIDMSTGETQQLPITDARAAEMAKNGESLPPWSQETERAITSFKTAQSQLDLLVQDVRNPEFKEKGTIASARDWQQYQPFRYDNPLGRSGRGLSGAKLKFLTDVNAAITTLSGMGVGVTRIRSATLTKEFSKHFPGPNDSPAVVEEKAQRISLLMDFSKRAMGFKGQMIHNPDLLAALDAAAGTTKITDPDVALSQASAYLAAHPGYLKGRETPAIEDSWKNEPPGKEWKPSASQLKKMKSLFKDMPIGGVMQIPTDD